MACRSFWTALLLLLVGGPGGLHLLYLGNKDLEEICELDTNTEIHFENLRIRFCRARQTSLSMDGNRYANEFHFL